MPLHFSQHPPAADLAPHVARYWILRGTPAPDDRQPIFPDGCPEIVLNLGAPIRERHAVRGLEYQPVAMLVGQMTEPVSLLPEATLDMVGIKLAPWGAAALFGEPGSSVRNEWNPLGSFGGMLELSAAQVRSQLADAGSAMAVRRILDDWLRALFRGAGAAGARWRHRVETLARAVGAGGRTHSVDAWARRLGCSSRTLERCFARYVGLAPKEFARIRRFQWALELARTTSQGWAAVAARSGYYDQAHLIRDFRQFAGGPPSLIVPQPASLTAAFLEPGTSP
jgi:AraC-like DNA-binding protein